MKFMKEMLDPEPKDVTFTYTDETGNDVNVVRANDAKRNNHVGEVLWYCISGRLSYGKEDLLNSNLINYCGEVRCFVTDENKPMEEIVDSSGKGLVIPEDGTYLLQPNIFLDNYNAKTADGTYLRSDPSLYRATTDDIALKFVIVDKDTPIDNIVSNKMLLDITSPELFDSGNETFSKRSPMIGTRSFYAKKGDRIYYFISRWDSVGSVNTKDFSTGFMKTDVFLTKVA
jgi:hypothetical protein